MRAPRAYLAGFGTSGSLLAGAALIFLLASAFVAFHGWPQVGDSPSTAAVSLPGATPQTGSPAARALHRAVTVPSAGRSSVHAAAAVRIGGRAQGGATTGGLVGQHGSVGSGAGGSGGSSAPGGGSPSGSGSSGPGTPTPSPQTCVGSACVPSSSTPGVVTGTVHKVTSTAGSALSTAVNTVTTVTGHLPGGAGGTVKSTTGSTTKTLSNVTHKVGGLL